MTPENYISHHSPFMRWYYSDAKLAQFTRSHYRWLWRQYQYLRGNFRGDPERKFLVLHDRALVYLVVPKVACTSIKRTLFKSCEVDGEVAQKIDLQYNVLPRSCRAYYKFAFVRNPFDRLVSCYRDKIIKEDNYFTRLEYHTYIAPKISFDEFARIVAGIPDYLADKHFRSQYFILHRRGKPVVDYVAKFEDLAEEWSILARQYDLEAELPHHNSSKTQPGTDSDYRVHYTKELATLVYERYKDDVHQFGYADAYRELIDFIERSKSSR